MAFHAENLKRGTNKMGKKHFTFVIEEKDNRNIEICAAIEGKQKSQILKEALTEYFSTKDYQSVFIVENHAEEIESNPPEAMGQTAWTPDLIFFPR